MGTMAILRDLAATRSMSPTCRHIELYYYYYYYYTIIIVFCTEKYNDTRVYKTAETQNRK